MAKPLISPLLLENSNKRLNPEDQTPLIQTPISRLASQPTGTASGLEFVTPRKKKDLRGHLAKLATGQQSLSTRRLLFRKFEKAFEEKDFELARLGQRLQAVETRLEATAKTRRKKVVPDPNSVFANIEDIHRAQVEAGRIEDTSAEESGSESSESEASCIVVR